MPMGRDTISSLGHGWDEPTARSSTPCCSTRPGSRWIETPSTPSPIRKTCCTVNRMVARFRVRGVPADKAFTFNLVDIHTDPDETATELDALADVFVGVQRNGSGEDDVILLGDLNVDEYHLGRLGQLPNIGHAITGVTTNTRRDKMYDNIVFDRRATTEYTGKWGVLDLMKEFDLTEKAALEVSDHCPVWAEFSMFESGITPIMASRPGSRE